MCVGAPLPEPIPKGSASLEPLTAGVAAMSFYIDPHIHMISRVTDDYHRMAQCGCVAVSEPAFWAGFDRGSAEGLRDYFRHPPEVEAKRTAALGLKQCFWPSVNTNDAENATSA